MAYDRARGHVLLYGGAGIVAAFVLAVLRNGRISFPPPSRYPGGVLTAVGTASFDEWLFRGVILGVLLTLGLPDWLVKTGRDEVTSYDPDPA